jgi:nucleoside 2-deoxyribosyltransferase
MGLKIVDALALLSPHVSIRNDCGSHSIQRKEEENSMPDKRGMPYVYLAGPDVFYADAMERAARMKNVLSARGMIGWFPLDTPLDVTDHPDRKALGLAIGDACETFMRKADMAIANIQPWRGPEADDGTSYEIGFMTALGKPVILYTADPRPFFERILTDVYRGEVYLDGDFTRGKSDHAMIEAFDGFADNLMLINAAVKSVERAGGERADPAAIVQDSFEAAAELAKKLWDELSRRT